jgi:hypothetical protein
MKNKSLTYVLLVVVAVVWYKVFVRVASNFGSEEFVENSRNKAPSIHVHSRDTFQLLANYRDPFGASKREMAQVAPQELPPPTYIKPKQVDYWPKIQYKGLIRKSDSTNPLALVYIDGNALQMRKGEIVFDGIKIMGVFRDSLIVQYKKSKRTFYRD